jgi:DNA-binding NarL/FixJ family response regulator
MKQSMIKIKIAIADDSVIFRDGLKVSLIQDKNFEIILEAGNGKELLAGMDKKIPDVILMDLKMPVMDGMEATKIIKKRFPTAKVLAVTMYEDEKFIIHLMETGANGYLLKNAEPEEIKKAIYAVAENGYYFNDLVSKALLKKVVIKQDIKPSFNKQIEFTDRELDVLKLICNEKTSVEIGEAIFLSPRSVEGIRQQLLDKIGVRNTAGLVMFAVRNGYI